MPGDFSSASFFIVLGVLASDKGIIIKNVNLNPTRDALIGMLKKMGADITINHSSDSSYCEPVADILCKKSALKGTEFSFYKTHKNTVIIVLGSSHRFGNVLYYPKYNRLPWKVTEGKKIVSIKEKLNSVDISEWNNKEQIMVYERI